jgi:hypothetical protein
VPNVFLNARKCRLADSDGATWARDAAIAQLLGRTRIRQLLR